MGDEDLYYRAYRTRDVRFDGRFFLGVTTTGVDCRPVCPAPRPKRTNVRFFTCAAAAEEAGFRPCRRCRPETSPGTPAWAGSSATVARALRLISAGAADDGGFDPLAARLGVTPRHLRRLFAKHLGASPLSVAEVRRAHFARMLIDGTHLSMREVATNVGFRSIRQFNHAIRKSFGESPTGLRNSARNRHPNGAAVGLEMRLPYRPPFDWVAVSAFLRERAIPGVEEVNDGAYRRTAELARTGGVIEVRPLAVARALLLRVPRAEPVGLLGLVARVRRLFDLDADPLRIVADHRRDDRLRPLLRPSRGVRVPGAWDPFEILVRAILGQQVSVRASWTSAGRLARAFGTETGDEPSGTLTHPFPGPEALADAPLERIGLPARGAKPATKEVER